MNKKKSRRQIIFKETLNAFQPNTYQPGSRLHEAVECGLTKLTMKELSYLKIMIENKNKKSTEKTEHKPSIEIFHGRKDQPNEYYEARMASQGINLVAQKSQPARANPLWFTYVVNRNESGMAGIRPVEVYEEREQAKRALETMYHTIIQFTTI